jgi:hypothetical protein
MPRKSGEKTVKMCRNLEIFQGKLLPNAMRHPVIFSFSVKIRKKCPENPAKMTI